MFSIIIPLFNEAESIPKLLVEIEQTLKNKEYEIVIVNDASTDNTLEILKKIKSKKIKLINNISNRGQSYSIHKGITNASYTIIITIDGDGQNDPADIPTLIKEFSRDNNIKLIGGIRTNRKDNLLKIVSSKLANFIRSRFLKDHCKDTGCSLKIFDRSIFLSFPYFDGIHRFLPALFNGYGYKTKFISVNHRKRKFGSSKYGIFKRLIRGIFDMIKVKKILINNK
tara:strand:+ start:212 stop:889 length:678 start_codon:yes stop_codon:yes gene_type:complete